MKIVLTGADGFLGWHTRVRLHALTKHDVTAVTRINWPSLPELVQSADAIIHIAGVNRGPSDDVRDGNIRLASDVADAIRASRSAPVVVFANSIQAYTDSPYGMGKRAASEILDQACAERGSSYVDVRLPNLFGEHGRPGYNSFVATFVSKVISGQEPALEDRDISLLHVQSAAQTLIDAVVERRAETDHAGTISTVGGVLRTLQDQYAVYCRGEIPTLRSRFDVDLFNTLRAAMVDSMPIGLGLKADERGTLVETVRAHGSEGQTFVSTTRPGVTRGQHFHLRKFERFVVVSGRAQISMRKALTRQVVTFQVDGDTPVAVDMPTGWAHNITNVGRDSLTTLFWTNELFDPVNTDTYAEEV